jgi:hypothetical protein
MSGVFRIIDLPTSHSPASVYPLPLVRGEDTLAGWRGVWGVNILEDARHSSVLYMCKYFVGVSKTVEANLLPLVGTYDLKSTL